MREDLDRPELQHIHRQERRLARRLYGRRRPLLPTLVEVGVVAIGAAGLWAAANFDRNADAGALFLVHRQIPSPSLTAAASAAREVTADPAAQVVIASATPSPRTAASAEAPNARADGQVGMANVTPRAPIEATKVPDVPAIADEGVSKTSAAPARVPTTEAAAVRKVPQSITPPTMLQVDSYLRRASELVALGDIAAARLLLSRAAEGKDSRALVALAETYDPVVLGRWRVVGMKPDPDRARALYQQALEAGNKAAGEHLLAMR